MTTTTTTTSTPSPTPKSAAARPRECPPGRTWNPLRKKSPRRTFPHRRFLRRRNPNRVFNKRRLGRSPPFPVLTFLRRVRERPLRKRRSASHHPLPRPSRLPRHRKGRDLARGFFDDSGGWLKDQNAAPARCGIIVARAHA